MKKTNKQWKDPFAKREASRYDLPIASRELILQVLQDIQKPLSYQALAKLLQLDNDEQKQALQYRLKAMRRDGQLVCNRRGDYGLIDHMHLISGYVTAHKEGFGFLIPDHGSDDIFLSAQQMRLVFPNDRVLVAINYFRGRKEGKITQILEHNTHQILGYFHQENGMGFVTPRSKENQKIVLISPSQSHNATTRQLVLAKITRYPTDKHDTMGEIISILGDPLTPGMATETAIHAYELPYEWSSAVIEESQQWGKQIAQAMKQGRKDLSNYAFITIDGEDAKDFDDAVYCQQDSKGAWLLFVAIADVSHYVLPDTALDAEAQKRGNSVYFSDKVIPMLPENLSNGLCSLKPNVERLSLVCEMRIDQAGKIQRYRFYPAVIKSHVRLTYTEVSQILTNNQAQCNEHEIVQANIDALYSLYQCLLQARKKRGALEFELPELKIHFDQQKKIEKIYPTQRNDAHRIIEECMLAANVCAANFLLDKKQSALFRNHPGPNPDKLIDLRRFLTELNLTLTGGDEPSPADYATLIEKIQDRPEFNLLQTTLLRSMNQAIYDTENEGHFGLAYPAYTHFTSPIRRYPDLLVHRAIYAALNYPTNANVTYPTSQLQPLAQHCSYTERRADQATRDATDQLKCEFMLDKLGNVYSGTIVNVTNFGLFIMLDDLFIEGLVHIANLPNDYYDFISHQHQLVGQRSQRKFQMGDVMQVRVTRVDVEQRQIDFGPEME